MKAAAAIDSFFFHFSYKFIRDPNSCEPTSFHSDSIRRICQRTYTNAVNVASVWFGARVCVLQHKRTC